MKISYGKMGCYLILYICRHKSSHFRTCIKIYFFFAINNKWRSAVGNIKSFLELSSFVHLSVRGTNCNFENLFIKCWGNYLVDNFCLFFILVKMEIHFYKF